MGRCLTRYLYPQIGQAVAKVLYYNNIETYIPDLPCCGVPALTAGDQRLPVMPDAVGTGFKRPRVGDQSGAPHGIVSPGLWPVKQLNNVVINKRGEKMSPRDEELVARSKAGDAEAFGELVQKYEHKIYNLAYRLVGNHADAADMAQDGLIRAFLAIKSYRGEASFQTWLYRIVTNVCRDELRYRNRRPQISLDESAETGEKDYYRQVADQRPLPDQTFEAQETQAEIQEAISALAMDYRMVLVMREFQDLSYEEIAATLHISIGTVKSRLSRARQNLRQKLAAWRELQRPDHRLMEKGGS